MLFPGDIGHVGEQRFADSMFAEIRADKDILEKQPRAALEGRIKFKENSVSRDLSIPLRYEGAEFRGGAETVALDVIFSQIEFVAQSLKLREFANQGGEHRRISNVGGADGKHRQAPG